MNCRFYLTLIFIFLIGCGVANAFPSLEEMEKDIFTQVNEYRKLKQKPQLTYDPLMSRVCRKHAEAMASGSILFSHDNIDNRFEEICKYISKVTHGAENLHWNQGYSDPATTAVKGWINSPSHHAAMIGDYNLTGVGGARSKDDRFYFNQFFVKNKKSK